MNIAAYCRVSTDKEDQLNSLEAQKRFFAEYTKQTGDRLVRLYADEGISGTKMKTRKEFMQMMQDAQTGLFRMVVVKDISRFARNTVDLLQNIRKLKALGIVVNFLTANMTNMGDSEFVLTLFGAMAQEESANTSKRVKFGKRINAQKGKVPNLVYGYDKTKGDYFHLAVNPKEAAVIRQMFDWYISGDGAAKISARLNEKGEATKRGCQWSQNAVCRVLTNELYTGKIINGKEEVADFLTGRRTGRPPEEWMVSDRPELKIIEPALFQKTQEVMRERGKRYRTDKIRTSNKHLFSTLIRCKECGRSFRRCVRTYQNTYVRWVCSGRNGNGVKSCPNAVSLPEEELIGVLEEYFAGILQQKRNLLSLAAEELEKALRARSENGEREQELHRSIARLNKMRQKYAEMYTDDLISREELREKIGGIKEEKERCESELQAMTDSVYKGERLTKILHTVFQKVADFSDVRQMRNADLRNIVQKIEVDREGHVEVWICLLTEEKTDAAVLLSDGRT